MKNKSTCKTGLKKRLISSAVFKREIELCRDLSHKNGGKCNWGKCKDCGVVPLLYKFHKGMLLEDEKKITRGPGNYLKTTKPIYNEHPYESSGLEEKDKEEFNSLW